MEKNKTQPKKKQEKHIDYDTIFIKFCIYHKLFLYFFSTGRPLSIFLIYLLILALHFFFKVKAKKKRKMQIIFIFIPEYLPARSPPQSQCWSPQ